MKLAEIKKIRKHLTDYVEGFKEILGRSERRRWCGMYISGLLLDGKRKSIEPMSKRLPGGNEQAMQQFVNQSPWDHGRIFSALTEFMLSKLKSGNGVLVLDDTSIPKKGKHSVGVVRQYCGALGKVSNCQSIVTWHYSSEKTHFPLTARLYLPKVWTSDVPRMERVGVPLENRKFLEKWKIALALLDGISGMAPHEVVVFDAGYGEIRPFLRELDKRNERFVGQIPELHSFWPLDVPITEKSKKTGRPRSYPEVADRKLKPMSAKKWREHFEENLASWKTVELSLKKKKKVKAVAVRVKEVNSAAYYRPGPERWLIIEKLSDGSFKYCVSNLPADAPLKQILNYAHKRWTIEQGYQQLKQELGFDHFEGRSWLGLHHHIALCFMAYCFLVLLRKKKLQSYHSAGAKVA